MEPSILILDNLNLGREKEKRESGEVRRERF